MTITLTKQHAVDIPLGDDAFNDAFDILPHWDAASYTAAEMAARGVDHDAIIRAFLRPDVMGASFGEVVCKVAEDVLPVFELSYPGDTRPRDAIEAARKRFASPTPANVTLADQAADSKTREAEAEAKEAARGVVVVVAGLLRDCTASAKAARGEAVAARCAAEAATGAACAARAPEAWADQAAAEVVMWAGAAGCSKATVIRLIEEASQTAD